MTSRDWILKIDAPRSVILVRFLVGLVFLSEGAQKFLFPEALGVGRFTKIGIPAPEVLAPFVGIIEIFCGVLLLGNSGFVVGRGAPEGVRMRQSRDARS
jgi:putative oxidoreductase